MSGANEFNELLERSEHLFRFMGIRFVEAKEGRAVTVMDYKEELTRIGGILHGGIIFTAMDYTGSYAVRSLGIKEAFTLQFSITFMRQMKKSPFKFEAEVIRRTKTYAFVEVRAYDGERALCALGNGVWHILE
jgi:acyl-CoA thioesterase